MSKLLDAYKAKYLLAANVMAINEAASVEQYAVKKKMQASQPHLFDSHAGQENLGVGRWITIGAEKDPDGEHHGGHHVFVGNDGRMKTGAFAGKTMDEAFGGKKDEKNSKATPNVAPATQGVASTRKPIEHNDATKKAVNDLLRVEALTQKRKTNNRDVDRAFAARSLLFDHGWSSDDVEKAMAEAKPAGQNLIDEASKTFEEAAKPKLTHAEHSMDELAAKRDELDKHVKSLKEREDRATNEGERRQLRQQRLQKQRELNDVRSDIEKRSQPSGQVKPNDPLKSIDNIIKANEATGRPTNPALLEKQKELQQQAKPAPQPFQPTIASQPEQQQPKRTIADFEKQLRAIDIPQAKGWDTVDPIAMKAARDQAEGIVKQAERELGHENTRSLDNFVAAYFPKIESKGFGDADFRVSGLPIPKRPQTAAQPEQPQQQQPAPSGIQQPPTAPGDQLGLFGDTFKAPPKKPMFEPTIATGGKQQGLFDTSGNANQMQLFGDAATPEDLVYKPEAKQETAPEKPDFLKGENLPPKENTGDSKPENNNKQNVAPTDTGPIPFRERKAFAAKMAAEGKTHSEIVEAMTSRGVAAVDARMNAAQALGDKAQGVGAFAKAEEAKAPEASEPAYDPRAALKAGNDRMEAIANESDPLFKQQLALEQERRELSQQAVPTHEDWKARNRKLQGIDKKLENVKAKLKPLNDEHMKIRGENEKHIQAIRAQDKAKNEPASDQKKSDEPADEELTPQQKRAMQNTATLEPKHMLQKPIKGSTGSSIVGYQWVSKVDEDELGRDKRVSDWTGSQKSENTGRDIVHLFWVQHPDGSQQLLGSGAAQKALGMNATNLRSVANRERERQAYATKMMDQRVEGLSKTASSSAEEADAKWKQANNASRSVHGNQAAYDRAFNESKVFTKDGKFIRTLDKELQAGLQERGWSEHEPKQFDAKAAIDEMRASGKSLVQFAKEKNLTQEQRKAAFEEFAKQNEEARQPKPPSEARARAMEKAKAREASEASKPLHEMSQSELESHINSQRGTSFAESTVEDWGNSMRGQGKRVKGMVRGAMAAVPQGKKTYTSIIGKLTGKEHEEAKLLEQHEQVAYVKAREAGIPHEHAMTWAWEHGGDEDFKGLTLKNLKESASPKPVPSEPAKPPQEAVTPTAKATNAHSEAIEQGSTPREAAKAAQKEMDADYAFARASTVRNAGEDLKGSARHRVNEWKSLEDAEKNGTAEAMVKRDELLKHEPHDLMSHAHKNPASSLAMHFAMRAFPAKPGSVNKSKAPKDREEYLAAYRDVKAKAEELAQKHEDPDKAISELQKHVRSMIDQKRIGDRTNATANDLVGLHNALKTGYFAPKTGPQARTQEFLDSVKAKYGEDWSSNEAIADNVISHAHDIMEGKSMNATFGKESKAQKRFDPSEMYVKIASRNGGRDLSKVASDPNKATKHLVDEMGLRGVQWGNTVSDDERQHHAARSVEALTDLAEILGVHPRDIALGGKLGLAIGARGRGGAVAHYEPDSQVINLTRANGVGSLAHEWGHAFDHYLNDFHLDSAKGDSKMMSDSAKHTHRITNPEGTYSTTTDAGTAQRHIDNRSKWKVEELEKSDIRKAFRTLKDAQSNYRDRLNDELRARVKDGSITEKKASEYWKSEAEIFARTFERYVQHKLESEGRKNTYLAGIETKSHKAGGLWPTDDEVKGMASAFDGIFEEYRKHHHGSPEKVKFSREHAMSALARYIERYAGKDQGVFDFADTDHEPVAATIAKGARKSMRKVEIAADTGGLRIVGISKDVDQCDRCGRTHLEKTIIVQVGDDEGERYYFGSDCISKIMGGEPSKWMAKAIDADYRNKVKAASTPKPKENYSDGWLSIERYEWNESLHPRVTAGQSTGGQFTHSGGGGSVGLQSPSGQPATGQSSDFGYKNPPRVASDNRQTDFSGRSKFKPTITGQEPQPKQSESGSSKMRDVVERPDLQKHHSLHINNQPPEMQIRLSDYAKSLRGLNMAAIRQLEWKGLPITDDSIWEHVDKSQLQKTLDSINRDNQASIASGGTRLDDLMNYNGVIPRSMAERLVGGSRFFDPEKLRGKWYEEAPQEQSAQSEQGDAPEPARSDDSQQEAQQEPEFDEWNQQGIEPAQKSDKISADEFKNAFRPKPPTGVSKFKMKQLEKMIRSNIRDDDEVVKAFVPLVVDAWKQVKSEVDAQNLALRQITGATAKSNEERDAKKGAGKTIQSLAALTRRARQGLLEPDEKKHFDEWVNDMESQFPHLLAGKGEMGLVDMISTGIKPAVDILDQEVAERAITLAGPDFFASMEDPGEPDFRDEFQPDYEQTPFSWINVPELFERARYAAKAERVRYAAKSEAQIEAGNYKKKHITVQGLRISIETKKGERRRPEWPPMPCDYGDIRGTDGADGDAVDVFVGPNHDSDLVVVVDQIDESGKWDEHKCILGFHSEAEAIECYKKAYTPGWKVGPVTTMTIKQFKAWLADGNTKKKISKQVSKYSWMFEPTLVSKYTWNEADHPRGQPENKGEFVAKGNSAWHKSHVIDEQAKEQFQNGEGSFAFRIQEMGEPLPEKSRNEWHGSDEEFMPGVSAYANMGNAVRDLLFGHEESVTGENYSKRLKSPGIVVMTGRIADGPGAEILVTKPRTAALLTREELEAAMRKTLEPEDRVASLEDILDMYTFSDEDVEDIGHAALKSQWSS